MAGRSTAVRTRQRSCSSQAFGSLNTVPFTTHMKMIVYFHSNLVSAQAWIALDPIFASVGAGRIRGII